jgi:hypothetical protein
MRKTRPTRASVELGPGTATTPRALPSAMASARSRPAARIPSLARLLKFARPSSTQHASPGQRTRTRAQGRGWSTPRRVHPAHARTRGPPAPPVLPLPLFCRALHQCLQPTPDSPGRSHAARDSAAPRPDLRPGLRQPAHVPCPRVRHTVQRDAWPPAEPDARLATLCAQNLPRSQTSTHHLSNPLFTSVHPLRRRIRAISRGTPLEGGIKSPCEGIKSV